MQKGEGRYKGHKPIFFPPTPIQCPPEQWSTIQNVSDLRPYYIISTYGRVYNIYSEQFIRPAIDSKGYPYVNLAGINGQKICRIHRLIMMTFCYFPGCEDYVVNHVDENRQNCFIWNLEWMSFRDNIRYSSIIKNMQDKDGGYSSIELVKDKINEINRIEFIPTGSGEGITTSKIVQAQAHEICKLLETGMTTKQVANQLGVTSAIVQGIVDGRTWKDVAANYNIPKQKYTNMNDDQIHYLCQCFCNDPINEGQTKRSYCEYILNKYKVLDHPYSENELRTAISICRRAKYQRISNQYNF